MNDPIVSVLMPSYRGAALIRQAIDSVLSQTMPSFEIIVVDDCSPDDTMAAAASSGDARVRVLRAPRNGGPAVARSIAMAAACGRMIAGLDHDDLCRPDRFARQLAYLDAHPAVVLVASAIAPFGVGAPAGDRHPDLTDPDAIDWTMLLLNPLAWSSVMMRGDAARALDPFQRDARRYAEDFDLYHRIRRHGRIGRIAEPLVRYRHHGAGASKMHEERMIAQAGAVLADAYGDLFEGAEAEAGLLMSRHAGARHAPRDAATLAACGRVLARLVAARGTSVPDLARRSASAHWWRIARAGLRAGAYRPAAIAAACPPFARGEVGARSGYAADRMVGAMRRLAGRRAI